MPAADRYPAAPLHQPQPRLQRHGDHHERPVERISATDRTGLEQGLLAPNSGFGYMGQPPVPEADVTRCYLDVVPRGGWPVIQVGVGPHGSERATGSRSGTEASVRGAASSSTLQRGIGELRGRQSTALPVRPEGVPPAAPGSSFVFRMLRSIGLNRSPASR